jgi:hypothetical protein
MNDSETKGGKVMGDGSPEASGLASASGRAAKLPFAQAILSSAFTPDGGASLCRFGNAGWLSDQPRIMAWRAEMMLR